MQIAYRDRRWKFVRRRAFYFQHPLFSIQEIVTMKRMTCLLSVTLSLFLTAGAYAQKGLVELSSDPFTNPTSQHATEVEPDTYAFGSTIVTAFQTGRISDGGSSDIGF